MARAPIVEHRRVVVAVGGEESLHAAAVAAHLAADKGELVFVHVVEVPLEFTLEGPPPDEEAGARRDAHDLLTRCQAVADRYGLSSKRVLLRRHAAGPAIVDTAAATGADLVVITGEQRFTRSGRVRLGTTATYVLKHAEARVLVLSVGAKAAGLQQVA